MFIDTPVEPERWAAHPDFPFYEVSTHGRVRSWKRRSEPHELKPALSPNGYLSVVLTGQSVRRTRTIHTLVLETFAGPKPEGWEVRHLNGNKRDNRLENLGWGTKKQNAADRKEHGTEVFGERNGLAKLTRETVLEARALKRAGMKTTELAAMYAVGIGTMSNALRGITWGHVPGAVPSRRKVRHLAAVR